jgi:hypothetical protein
LPIFLLTPGAGARTVRALALGRFSDPARFSLAHGHGGKDRHPFPALLEVYDETIGVLKAVVRAPSSARTSAALARLDRDSRRLPRTPMAAAASLALRPTRVPPPPCAGK